MTTPVRPGCQRPASTERLPVQAGPTETRREPGPTAPGRTELRREPGRTARCREPGRTVRRREPGPTETRREPGRTVRWREPGRTAPPLSRHQDCWGSPWPARSRRRRTGHVSEPHCRELHRRKPRPPDGRRRDVPAPSPQAGRRDADAHDGTSAGAPPLRCRRHPGPGRRGAARPAADRRGAGRPDARVAAGPAGPAGGGTVRPCPWRQPGRTPAPAARAAPARPGPRARPCLRPAPAARRGDGGGGPGRPRRA